MIHEQSILAAVRVGNQTSAEIAMAIGRKQVEIIQTLMVLTRIGCLYRTSIVREGRIFVCYRYRLPNAPDVVAERRARVERMREWHPARLHEMKNADA